MVVCDFCTKAPVEDKEHPWIVVNMPGNRVDMFMPGMLQYRQLIFCSRRCLWLSLADPVTQEVSDAE